MGYWGVFPILCLLFSHLALDARHVASAEALDLAAEFEIAPDAAIVEDAETIHDGHRLTRHFQHLLRRQLQVSVVADSKDHGIGPLDGFGQVFLNTQFSHVFLVPEEP